MFHIPQSRKFSTEVTVHLESFSGKDNDNLIFCPLQVSYDVLDRSSIRGFWEISESGTLVHRIGNFRPVVVG